jgi:hypothetical protein
MQTTNAKKSGRIDFKIILNHCVIDVIFHYENDSRHGII